MNKVQGIMYLGRHNTITEAWALIGVDHYYMDMRPMKLHVLTHLVELASGPKARQILWNEYLELALQELKWMVSSKTLLDYPDCRIMFNLHTYASDQQLGVVISQN